MDFKEIFIPAEGRQKYGINGVGASSSHRTLGNATYIYGDKDDHDDGNNNGGNNGGDTNKSFLLFLSKTQGNFDGQELAAKSITDTVNVFGFYGTNRSDVYVGSIEIKDDNRGIKGLPDKGLSVEVFNNGTPNAYIKFTVTKEISENNGTLVIPTSVYLDDFDGTSLGDNWDTWNGVKADCKTLALEYSWSVSTNAANVYTLDLTNENASINCDADGNILAGATRPTCTAKVYFGTELFTGATFSIDYDSTKEVQGVSINTATGVLTFGSNFSFKGTSLEVSVSAMYMGEVIGTKIMTISKAYPGKDGIGAVTRWLVPSVDAIKFNPNTLTISPSSVTVKCMKQVGEDEPIEDTSVRIYYGWDTTNPTTTYTSAVSSNPSKKYLNFALRNSSNVIYENETIPVLTDGKNGENATSVYTLDLSNESAGINCDKDGNILPTAVRPKCTAKLFHGENLVNSATFTISAPNSTGLSITTSNGVATLQYADNFNFTGDAIEVMFRAFINDILYGTKIMTITKQIAGQNGADGEDGEDGQDAVTYWLDLSHDEIKVDKNGSVTPTSITVKRMKQVGGNDPVEATECTIKYGYNTVVPTTTTTGTISNISSNKDKNYLTVHLYKGASKLDGETIFILRDGIDGQKGDDGRNGAALRGPVDYANQTATRRWCNGVLTDASYPEDEQFIDIIYRLENGEGVYYYCNTSYNGSSKDSWTSVKSKWTKADAQYDFIATNLLLAKNAKINFLTSQGIYLGDKDGNVTAGIEGADNENDVVFWAGANEPANANFTVDYSGNIVAKSGTFAGYVQLPYTYINELSTNFVLNNTTIGTYERVDLIWKGSLASAPSNPSNLWGYVNSSTNIPYVYKNGTWYRMTPVRTNGYIADKRCNIVVDGSAANYGMFDGADLILPEPSAEYNGYTYRIIMEPNIATKTPGLNHSVTVRTKNTSKTFKMYFHGYATLYEQPYAVMVFGGSMTITCIPTSSLRDSYQWCITECTGGGDCYDKDGNNKWSFGTVCSYNSDASVYANKSDYCINRIVCQSQFTSDANKTDTLKIQR